MPDPASHCPVLFCCWPMPAGDGRSFRLCDAPALPGSVFCAIHDPLGRPGAAPKENPDALHPDNA